MLSVIFEFFRSSSLFVEFFFVFTLFLPFVSCLGLGLRSFYLCQYDTPTLYSLILMWLSFEGSFVLFDYFSRTGLAFLSIEGPIWFSSPSVSIYWGLHVDYVTLMMFMVVTFISWLVHFYSVGYMSNDPRYNLFFSYLSLFTFFMLILVSSETLIQLFIGWEGVGLCSFLLISFWNTRLLANKAALKAMIVNKFGDYFLLLGLSFVVAYFGTLSISELFFFDSFSISAFVYNGTLFATIPWFGIPISIVSVISFFLFLGVMAKSAQFGLHTWLPDAMEGPTPVSALIHAATMVTAGVFLLIRLYFFFLLSPSVNSFIIVIGTLTTFFAATVALVQNDIKKIVAYSTCSQLGYMVMACGFNLYGFAFYHLVTHAFFKALLFLCAGSVIHAVLDEQDIRKMGGLASKLPVTFFCMFIGSLSLAGFPFLSGFYSKESILESVLATGTSLGFFAYFFGVISVFFTTFYSFRLLFLVFFVFPNGFSSVYRGIHKTSFYILLPLIILSFLSIFLGKWSQGFFFSLRINYDVANFSIPLVLRLLPLVLVFLAFCLAVIIYLTPFRWDVMRYDSLFLRFFYNFLNKKWYVDSFYNFFLSRCIFFFSFNTSFLLLEKGWIEFFGPTGISNFSLFLASFFLKFQTSRFNDYLFYSICIIFFLLLL